MTHRDTLAVQRAAKIPAVNINVLRNGRLDDELTLFGVDLTGATIKAQVRTAGDAPGNPLFTISTGLLRVEEWTVDEAREQWPHADWSAYDQADGTDTFKVSFIQLIAGGFTDPARVPPSSDAGGAVLLEWDLIKVEPAGNTVLCRGSFNVGSGVTL